MRRIMLIVSLCLLLGCVPSVSVAAEPPGFPAVFYGSVSSEAIGPDMQVIALVDGIACGSAYVQDDPSFGLVYVLDVLPDDPTTTWRDGGRSGDIVRFNLVSPVSDITPLLQTAIWVGGSSTKVNLSDHVTITLPLIITQ